MLLGVLRVLVWGVQAKAPGSHLEEGIDDAAVAKEVDHPEEEEGNGDDVDDERVLGREVAPVRVDELEHVLGDAVEVGGALRVDQVVLGIHVDAIVWLPLLAHGGAPTFLK